MDYLSKDIAIACKAHEIQKDKAGESYILYPLRLMMRLQDETARIVAVLHDVLTSIPALASSNQISDIHLNIRYFLLFYDELKVKET